jgi:hypothetical protein
LLAPEEMSVSSRTLAGAGGGGGRVVWCWGRPVCGVVPGGGGHQRRLASPNDLRAALRAEHEDDMVGDDTRRMRAMTRVA